MVIFTSCRATSTMEKSLYDRQCPYSPWYLVWVYVYALIILFGRPNNSSLCLVVEPSDSSWLQIPQNIWLVLLRRTKHHNFPVLHESLINHCLPNCNPLNQYWTTQDWKIVIYYSNIHITSNRSSPSQKYASTLLWYIIILPCLSPSVGVATCKHLLLFGFNCIIWFFHRRLLGIITKKDILNHVARLENKKEQKLY